MELDTAKGMRDINPDEELFREQIVRKMQVIFARYGFMPLNTPIIERYDVLSAKFAAGEESDAMSEVYKLKDNGNRELGLRFDLTVPFARYVGMNRTLKMPFKRYQIGKVYRDAPIKMGRYREFTQCDVDIVGTTDLMADATCINVALDVYKELGVDATIGVNNRKFLFSLFVKNGIPEDKLESAIMSIDKLNKLSVDEIVKETNAKGLNEDSIRKIIDIVRFQGSNDEKLNFFAAQLSVDDPGIVELKELLSYFPNDDRVVFVPSLARGLGYYTGTVFEVYSKEKPEIGAISAGGRYDELVDSYLESVGRGIEDRTYPAVGISFGLDRTVDVLKQLGQVEFAKTNVKLFIVPIGKQKESFAIAQQFRDAGINVDIDLMKRGPSKNFAYADSYKIPFVAVIGENELNENVITLKNMADGTEEKLSVADAINKLK